MINFRCSCGAPIGMPDHAAGKTAKCMTCGSRLVVPALTQSPVAAPAAPDDDIPLELEPEPPRPVTRAPTALPPREPERPAALHTKYTTASSEAHASARQARKQRGYFADALASFLIPLTPLGLVAMTGLTTLLVIMNIIPILVVAILAMLIAYGALAAYCFEVIVDTAGGEDSLPMPAGIEEWASDLPEALIAMVATILATFFPMILVGTLFPMIGISDEATDIAMLVAMAAGVFIFPVAILCVAMGGMGTLLRPDYHIRTILSAPGQYLLIWCMLLLVFAVQVGVGLLLESEDASEGFLAFLLTIAVSSLLTVYGLIVTMRQIGLFYRHFSDRFPWSAG
ncbi:MAG: hypothetical protein KF684_02240 [Phycisphaeraceae bacterium]|nr:hypothetical protein [Phycisphaeraceae bacterium]